MTSDEQIATAIRAAHPDLAIAIVGAGIAGLSCALALARAGFTRVRVFESAQEIAEVGAGLQLAPNFTRALRRLGLLDRLRPHAVALESNSLRRYKDNTILGNAPLMPAIEQKYGSPLWVVHRGDLQRVLKEAVHELGVEVRTGARVTDVDFARTRLKIRWTTSSSSPSSSPSKSSTAAGQEEWVQADVILAADGIKSIVRKQLLALYGEDDRARETGDAAYRVLVPREKLEGHPDMLAMLDSTAGYRWMGPKRHIMAYAIKAHQVFNMVLIHPDRNDTAESWTNKGTKDEMMALYGEWNPIVQRLLEFVDPDEIMEWKLMDHLPLPTWVERQTALVGDAAHPMLPYVAQGAAQAVEDACVLAACLAAVLPPCTAASGDGEVGEQVQVGLKLYERIRKERAERIQASAATNRAMLHLPDGEEQEARDEEIRQALQSGRNPDLWADPAWQEFMYKDDTTVQALDAVRELGPRLGVPATNVDDIGANGLTQAEADAARANGVKQDTGPEMVKGIALAT